MRLSGICVYKHEATSSIDTETEIILQKGLNELLKGRTSFIIAHRLSTIQNCTRILYVDKGRIQESGSHDELLAQKGSYYHLYMSQYSFMKNADELAAEAKKAAADPDDRTAAPAFS